VSSSICLSVKGATSVFHRPIVPRGTPSRSKGTASSRSSTSWTAGDGRWLPNLPRSKAASGPKPACRRAHGNTRRTAGQRPAPTARATPGTMNALALSFFAAPSFSTLGPSTRNTYRWTIERLCREHGDKRVALLRRQHIVKLMAARTPGAANKLRKALRAMMTHAVALGLLSDDPTSAVRAIQTRTAGFHSWSDVEISQFEERHPVGSRARLAMALLLYSGQRRGDVIRMGPQHVRNGVLYIKQEKTGAELAIPVHPELATIIASVPRHHLTFLTTRFDRPFEASTFSHWFRDQCNAAGLPHCSAHGLVRGGPGSAVHRCARASRCTASGTREERGTI
jgi:integrase